MVRASRTPGKTKSLQTIYWSKDVRLVDCPGLVFPSYVGMEKQVMAGVIPIQNVSLPESLSLPQPLCHPEMTKLMPKCPGQKVEAVIHELGERMPLERILDLKMPEELVDERQGVVWSTDTLLATFALDRGMIPTFHSTVGNIYSLLTQSTYFSGFLTAKAARPDVYRSGSMLIRAFHASQIAWAFRPTIEEVPDIHQEGIWLPDFQAGKAGDIGSTASNLTGQEMTDAGETTGFEEVTSEEESEVTEDETDNEEGSEENGEKVSNLDTVPSATSAHGRSAFALLALDDDGDGEEGSPSS